MNMNVHIHNREELLAEDSEIVYPNALVDNSVHGAEVSTVFQFERLGYFVVDKDSTVSKMVFNRIIQLRAALEEKDSTQVKAHQKKAAAMDAVKDIPPTEFYKQGAVCICFLSSNSYLSVELTSYPFSQYSHVTHARIPYQHCLR